MVSLRPGVSMRSGRIPHVTTWTATRFILTLVLLVATVDRGLRARIDGAGGRNLIGSEVYTALTHARTPDTSVTQLIIGDSVARQFFPTGREPSRQVRFLTTNAAITMAGFYYLAEDAFRACPRARDIVVICRPETLRGTLDAASAVTYFSGFFHTPAQMAEVWWLQHNPAITLPQVARWLMPGLLATNAAWRQPPRSLDTRLAMDPFARVPADTVGTVRLSLVGRHYLARLRDLARSHGGSVRVLAAPLPDDRRWTDPMRHFDAELLYVNHDALGDGIHVGAAGQGARGCLGTGIARAYAAQYGLLAALPLATEPADGACEAPGHPARLITPSGLPSSR